MAGRREENRARTRAAVIDAGVRLMHERGFDATSTTDIARAAGISPATLFNHFPTKASIFFADDDLWVPPPVPGPAGSTPRATARALVLAVADQPAWTRPVDDPLTRMRFELVQREPALAEAQTARAFAKVPAFAAALREAHPDLPEADATALAGAAVGAVIAAITWTPLPDLRAAVERALDALG